MSQSQSVCAPADSRGAPCRHHPYVQFALTLVGHVGYLMALACAVLTSVLVLLPLSVFPRVRRRISAAMLHTYLRFFALRYLPAFAACRIVEISQNGQLTRPDPAIFVANHRSAIDAILLLALLPPTSPIIKARHARKLAYACLVRFFDFISMDAGSLSVLRRSMDKCRRLMEAGTSLLVFPEGTRTSSTTLKPFATFAFKMAVEQGATIVPVAIHSDRPFLNRQKGSYFPRETVNFRIRFLEPVSAGIERDPDRLSDLVSHRISTALAELDRLYLKHDQGLPP